MKPFEKLFVYALTTGMEKLGDSVGALKYIDDILETNDDILWIELKRAINQAKRVNGDKEVDIDIDELKTLINQQIQNRC